MPSKTALILFLALLSIYIRLLCKKEAVTELTASFSKLFISLRMFFRNSMFIFALFAVEESTKIIIDLCLQFAIMAT